MSRVSDPLREYASIPYRSHHRAQLLRIADEIDREHERRMEQSRRDTRHAFARYLRSVIADYLKGYKRLHEDAFARYRKKAGR